MERLQNPPEWEFYDLDADPNEFVEMSSNPAFQEEIRRLKEALRDWRLRTDDPFYDLKFRENVERQYKKLTN